MVHDLGGYAKGHVGVWHFATFCFSASDSRFRGEADMRVRSGLMAPVANDPSRTCPAIFCCTARHTTRAELVKVSFDPRPEGSYKAAGIHRFSRRHGSDLAVRGPRPTII